MQDLSRAHESGRKIGVLRHHQSIDPEGLPERPASLARGTRLDAANLDLAHSHQDCAGIGQLAGITVKHVGPNEKPRTWRGSENRLTTRQPTRFIVI